MDYNCLQYIERKKSFGVDEWNFCLPSNLMPLKWYLS